MEIYLQFTIIKKQSIFFSENIVLASMKINKNGQTNKMQILANNVSCTNHNQQHIHSWHVASHSLTKKPQI